MDEFRESTVRCEGAEGKLSICWDWDVKLEGILAAANRAVIGHHGASRAEANEKMPFQ